jgi:UTP--glucose-1-phosphate uridylyltransferase
MESREELIRRRMEADGAPTLVIEAFLRNVGSWLGGDLGTIADASLDEMGNLVGLEDLPEPSAAAREHLRHAVVVKLNGGLGTSMGLDHAKSLMVAKDGLTFLDVIVRQIRHLRAHCETRLPLLLMNSFSTDGDTRAALAARHADFDNAGGVPVCFSQHRVPKLLAESGYPAQWPEQPSLEWCPPGHADIFHALQTTGILERLLSLGFRHAFVSNADNLGAVFHPGILEHMAQRGIPFLMEVTARTESDRKGGHLARDRASGRYLLRESAQCPADETEDFQNIRKHRFFNTNNLWFDLAAVRDMLAASGGLPALPLIVNRKTVDPTRSDSPAVVQLESAMGFAISCFEESAALVVPRTRFAPVKTTADLLALRSDLYAIADDQRVALHPEREDAPTDVRLDPRFYRNVEDFDLRFPKGPPSLLRCRSLSIEGDFRFGAGVRLEGRVQLRSPGDAPVFVADGAVLRDRIDP